MIPFSHYLFPSVRKQFPVFFNWCINFGCHSAVLFITSVRYSNRFTLCILQSECYRIEYGASFGPLMAAEEQ